MVLADDMAVIRQGVRAMLGEVKDVEIVGEAADGEEALRVARALKPDVLLIDQDLQGGGGIQAARELKHELPETEVIVMADQLDGDKALEATEAGATGYISKDIPPENLAAAVKSVTNGRAFYHPQITRTLLGNLGRLVREQRRRAPATEGLTPRQFDILVELTKGSTYNQIANKFVVTEGTIKTHIHNMLRKMGCQNRTQLATYALRKGLVK